MITKSFKGITLSGLGMGNMRLPCKSDGEIDYARGEAMIDSLMKAGVNYYDTAYVYHSGKSEDFVGKALVSRYPRDSYYIEQCSSETLRKFASHRKWDFAQLQINYYDWVYGNAKEQYELLCELGIPVMVMEPVRGGKLAELSPAARDMLTKYRPEWSIASWAFRWLMKLDNVAVILMTRESCF